MKYPQRNLVFALVSFCLPLLIFFGSSAYFARGGAAQEKPKPTTLSSDKYGVDKDGRPGTVTTESDEHYRLLKETYKDPAGKIREETEIEYRGDKIVFYGWRKWDENGKQVDGTVKNTYISHSVTLYRWNPEKKKFDAIKVLYTDEPIKLTPELVELKSQPQTPAEGPKTEAPKTEPTKTSTPKSEPATEPKKEDFHSVIEDLFPKPDRSRDSEPSAPPPNNIPTSVAPGYSITVASNGDGLSVVNINTPTGRIKVNLPDDMAAGDTISGTVEAEPAGRTPAERAQNQAELNGYVIEREDQSCRVGDAFTQTIASVLTDMARTIKVVAKNNKKVASCGVPVLPKAPATPNGTEMPTGGQQGRPGTIRAICDGKFLPTDFVKIGGEILRTLAESPRKKVFRNTSEAAPGPTKIECNERGKVTECPFHNLGIKLSAPKLNLLKGETTTLQVVVLGLAGVDQDVPLELSNKSPDVIAMAAGNEQRLTIHRADVQAGGVYSTDRTLTGIRAGSFNIIGTVRWAGACRNGNGIAEGPEGEQPTIQGGAGTRRDPDENYEVCGPGCKSPTEKDGNVFCVQQGACKDRGGNCECNLFEAPKGDKSKSWTWVASPFPAKWLKVDGMEYSCQCTKKK